MGYLPYGVGLCGAGFRQVEKGIEDKCAFVFFATGEAAVTLWNFCQFETFFMHARSDALKAFTIDLHRVRIGIDKVVWKGGIRVFPGPFRFDSWRSLWCQIG